MLELAAQIILIDILIYLADTFTFYYGVGGFCVRMQLKTLVGLQMCVKYIDPLKSFLVWGASCLPVTVSSRQCLDRTVGKIENGLERCFVKHRLNCILITDPNSFCSVKNYAFKLTYHNSS